MANKLPLEDKVKTDITNENLRILKKQKINENKSFYQNLLETINRLPETEAEGALDESTQKSIGIVLKILPTSVFTDGYLIKELMGYLVSKREADQKFFGINPNEYDSALKFLEDRYYRLEMKKFDDSRR